MKRRFVPREVFLDFDPVFPGWPHDAYPDEVDERDRARLRGALAKEKPVRHRLPPGHPAGRGSAPKGERMRTHVES